jgi:hypothetical protein
MRVARVHGRREQERVHSYPRTCLSVSAHEREWIEQIRQVSRSPLWRLSHEVDGVAVFEQVVSAPAVTVVLLRPSDQSICNSLLSSCRCQDQEQTEGGAYCNCKIVARVDAPVASVLDYLRGSVARFRAISDRVSDTGCKRVAEGWGGNPKP